jgi:drug/metabolite transporter (DMT)-like permease
MNPASQHQPLAGILLMVASLWTLSVLDGTAKWLAAFGIPIVLLSWARYAVHAAVLAAVVVPRRGWGILRSRRPGYQLLRACLMLSSTVLFFSVLKLLPLAEATAINFCSPFIILALSPWLLKEPPRWSRWLGVACGFVGMLIVVRPGSGLHPLGVALGFLTALVFAIFQIVTRKLADEDPLTTNLWGGLFGTAALLPVLPFYWQHIDLSPLQWAIVLSMGIIGLTGHMLQISAFRCAPASLLSPFVYLQIVSATTVGYLYFHQLPDAWTAAGIAVICASGAVVAWTEWRQRSAALAGMVEPGRVASNE